MPRIGILAFGSLIDEPGDAIRNASESQILTQTPFNVEFARSSTKRFGGPTLIPVANGGARVKAVIFLLKDTTSVEDAETVLWRRETGKTSGQYRHRSEPGPNDVEIKRLEDFCNLDIVLYTSIGGNINPLTAAELARLAIQSAKAEAQRTPEDGISYLIAAKRNGIVTPLSVVYEKAILAATGAESLETAFQSIQTDVKRSCE